MCDGRERGVPMFTACRILTDVYHASEQCFGGAVCRVFARRAAFHEDAGTYHACVSDDKLDIPWVDWTERVTNCCTFSRPDYTPSTAKGWDLDPRVNANATHAHVHVGTCYVMRSYCLVFMSTLGDLPTKSEWVL